MGSRAASRLARRIARHLVPWRDRPWPVDWAAEMGREAPLWLEIGFGAGEFLEAEARAHPGRDHVGIEVSWASADRLLKRVERAGLTNVRVLLAEAEAAVQLLFASESLDEVVINHPCPWPKDRHEARRLVSPALLALLADRMRTGAPLTIATDHAGYAEWTEAVLTAQRALEPLDETPCVRSLEGRMRTRYELKALARGEGDYYFRWRRGDVPVAAAPAPRTEPIETMPSLTLSGPLEFETLLDGFESCVEVETLDDLEVVCKLEHAWRRSDGNAWLVTTLVREGPLQQRFALEVLRLRDGGAAIRLAETLRPHPTLGVKRAIWHLQRRLVERCPGLEVAHSNLGQAAMRP